MEQMKKEMKEFWGGYYKHLDKRLLRDLVVEIMGKGYFPIIRSKRTPPTVDRTEKGYIHVSQPLDDSLVLYTADELRDIDIEPSEYLVKTLRKLEDMLKEK